MIQNQPTTTGQSVFRFLRFQNWRIVPKLLIAFLFVALVPTAITAASMTQGARDALLNQGAVTLVSRSINTSVTLDQYLASKVEDLVAISQMNDVINFVLTPNNPQYLTNAQNALQPMTLKADYESMTILGADATVLTSSKLAELGSRALEGDGFRQALQGQVYISDPMISPFTNQPVIYFSAPIRRGNIAGVLRSSVRLEGIWSIVERDKDSAGPGTFGILLDENGLRLATSQSAGKREEVLNKSLFTSVAPLAPEKEQTLVRARNLGQPFRPIRVVPLPEVANALGKPELKTFETNADNSDQRHYAAIAKMSTKSWYYVLMTPLTTFTSTADSFRWFWLIISIVIAVLTAIGALMIARGLATPIVQLTQAADRISLGELDTPININRADEIGELAEAIRRMQASLHLALERLHAHRTSS
jgi:HAMP domain-containing protein